MHSATRCLFMNGGLAGIQYHVGVLSTVHSPHSTIGQALYFRRYHLHRLIGNVCWCEGFLSFESLLEILT